MEGPANLLGSGYSFFGPDMEAVTEIICDRLYFVTYRKKEFFRVDRECHYFNTDQQLVYTNFFNDFGPLNLAQLYRYWLVLREKLNSPTLMGKKIVHWTTTDFKKRANAAFLIGCFAVLHLSMTPQHVLRLLLNSKHPFVPFQDACQGLSKYRIKLIDCFSAVDRALHLGFINFDDFDLTHYEHYERAQNGDMNWIIPEKMLAFSGPSTNEIMGCPPETYIPYFQMNRIRDIVRLNRPNYQDLKFTNAGVRIHDLFFCDGTVPTKNIVHTFLGLAENLDTPIAVHCKAGLGRTGCLIGAYLIKHYQMTALEAIAWMRICRPGCVIGHQQAWLEKMQVYLNRSGQLYRLRMHGDMEKLPYHGRGVYSLLTMKKHHQRLGDAGNVISSVKPKEKKSKTRTLQNLIKLGDRRKKKKTVKFASETYTGLHDSAHPSGTHQGDSLRLRKWENTVKSASDAEPQKTVQRTQLQPTQQKNNTPSTSIKTKTTTKKIVKMKSALK